VAGAGGTAGVGRQPDFRRLWLARTVSRFGSLLGALPFTAVFFLDATPGQMALLTVFTVAPGFLGGLVAGVWVDRLRRRPLMMAADVGRAAALGSLLVAAATGGLTFPHLYTVAVVNGVLEVVFDVAAIAFLPSVVGRDQLVAANSRLVAADAVIEAGSFSVGGWIVQLSSAMVAVAVDAVSFVVSAVSLAAIKTSEVGPARREGAARPGAIAEAREGFALLGAEPVLRSMAISLVLRDLGYGLVGAVILLFVARDLGFSPGAMGLIFAAGGVSSFLGAVATAGITARIGQGWAMVGGAAVATVGTVLVAVAGGSMLVAAGFLVASQLVGDGAMTVYEINQESTRQSLVPDRLLGRVDAAIRVAGLGATLAGALAAGFLGGAVDLRLPLALGAAANAAAAVSLLPARNLRQ
jgi:MFS family permease